MPNRIITRAEWSARRPKTAPAHVPISARTATCTHHDGPHRITVRTFGEACALVRRDQSFHMDGNGWADIGYNYLVISARGCSVDGMVFEGRGRDAVGAHCLNHNTPWIGIQVAIGGGQIPSPAALASVRWLHDTLQASAGHPLGKKVHSDGFATACPDPILRAWVHAGMPLTKPPKEPDMPLTAPEKQDISDLVVHDLLSAKLGSSGPSVAVALQHASALTNVDPVAFAKAVVAALPKVVTTGNVALDPATAEAILRKVFLDAGTP